MIPNVLLGQSKPSSWFYQRKNDMYYERKIHIPDPILTAWQHMVKLSTSKPLFEQDSPTVRHFKDIDREGLLRLSKCLDSQVELAEVVNYGEAFLIPYFIGKSENEIELRTKRKLCCLQVVLAASNLSSLEPDFRSLRYLEQNQEADPDEYLHIKVMVDWAEEYDL